MASCLYVNIDANFLQKMSEWDTSPREQAPLQEVAPFSSEYDRSMHLFYECRKRMAETQGLYLIGSNERASALRVPAVHALLLSPRGEDITRRLYEMPRQIIRQKAPNVGPISFAKRN
ncbi:hypothetical protein MesoLj131a_48590 [Mesorhizobium sp. 131-2-1]|nr:hypothetical protein MesoLj131a_48590 [Mesorhizobium sp. 131-2-1]